MSGESSSTATADSPNCFYRLYGLLIRSDLVLPELQSIPAGSADIEITLGSVPEALPGAEDVGLRYQAARGRLLLTVDYIARYLVLDGERIVIELFPKADENTVRLFLLSSAFAALLHQREELVLRGSAVDVGGKAVAFLGPAGIGKSTLAAAMVEKGYRLLADELCVVRADVAGRRLIQPEFPQLKLWPDAMRQLGMLPSNFASIREGLAKRVVPMPSTFTSDALPIQKMYVLRAAPNDDIEVKSLDSGAAYTALETRVHLSPVIRGIGAEGTYRQMALSFVQSTNFTAVTRPRRKSLFADVIAQVEADFSL